MSACRHFDGLSLRDLPPGRLLCAECVRSGDTWVHLRMCLGCGNIGCCDSSKNRHARRHAEATGHQVMRSAEPGENWAYCFADDVARILA